MKLTNSTDFDDRFLRRMIAWSCKNIRLPVRYLRRATFTKCRGAYSGHGGGRGIRVRIGPESRFPVAAHLYPGKRREAYMQPELRDRIEALVSVTVHELTHVRQLREAHHRQRSVYNERDTTSEERRCIELFRNNREALLASWSKPLGRRASKPTITRQQRNHKRTIDAFDRWQRKLKLAQTKVRKLKHRLRYYERAAANRSSNAHTETEGGRVDCGNPAGRTIG